MSWLRNEKIITQTVWNDFLKSWKRNRDFDWMLRSIFFVYLQTLIFNSTNICSFQQINALTSLRRLDNLTIQLDGNPVTKFTLWKSYVLFRLSHFALKKINDQEVSWIFRSIPEFRILRLTFHGKSASKCWIQQIIIGSLIYIQSVLR